MRIQRNWVADTLLVVIKNGTATLETFWQVFPKTLNMQLPCNPAILLLGSYPREMKIYIYTETCTRMLIAALFIIAQNARNIQMSSS